VALKKKKLPTAFGKIRKFIKEWPVVLEEFANLHEIEFWRSTIGVGPISGGALESADLSV